MAKTFEYVPFSEVQKGDSVLTSETSGVVRALWDVEDVILAEGVPILKIRMAREDAVSKARYWFCGTYIWRVR
jgi:hypothetical protein